LNWKVQSSNSSLNGTDIEIRTRITIDDAEVKWDGLNTTDESSVWILKMWKFPYYPKNEPPKLKKVPSSVALELNEILDFKIAAEDISNDTISLEITMPK